MAPRVCTDLESRIVVLSLYLLVPLANGSTTKKEVILWVEFDLGGG